MIKNLEIKNFKSIKHLKLDCKRVNLFIGKPNTGKSNILESIGIFSISHGEFRMSENLKKTIRFESILDLFYDKNNAEKIEIVADNNNFFEIKFENGKFIANGKSKEIYSFKFEGEREPATFQKSGVSPFKFYKFEIMDVFPSQEFNFLLPPQGENLFQILRVNRNLLNLIGDILSEFGIEIALEERENKIKIQKRVEKYVVISFPYSIISNTLQRIIFYLVAIETNKDSIIIFEEPEAHSFPYYTKFLAERIGMDETNQYFISTHNPYFLLSVLEKTPKDNIGIYITYFKDYQTKVRPITEEEMPEIFDLDASIFFNLDRFMEEG